MAAIRYPPATMNNTPRRPSRVSAYIVPLFCALAAGCGGINGIRGSSVVVSETREVRAFSAIDLSGVGTVRLQQTGTESLTVEAEENLLPFLVTRVENGTLRIGTKPNVNIRPTQPIVFHVTADRIDNVGVCGSGNIDAGALKASRFAAHASGSGNVRAESVEAEKVTARIAGSGGVRIDRLQTRNLRCDVSGSGNVRVAGMADEVDLGISGSGSLHAADLACTAADVSIAGSGNVRLGTTEQRLSADVSGSGSLRYRGKPPEVQTRVSGSGSVSRDAG